MLVDLNVLICKLILKLSHICLPLLVFFFVISLLCGYYHETKERRLGVHLCSVRICFEDSGTDTSDSMGQVDSMDFPRQH